MPNNPSTDDEMTTLMIERGIAYVFRPQVSQLAGGSFEARYPAADWSAAGASRDDAIANLGEAALNRRGTRETSWQVTAVREHLAHGPLDGVYEIPLDVNDRIMASKDPLAALPKCSTRSTPNARNNFEQRRLRRDTGACGAAGVRSPSPFCRQRVPSVSGGAPSASTHAAFRARPFSASVRFAHLRCARAGPTNFAPLQAR